MLENLKNVAGNVASGVEKSGVNASARRSSGGEFTSTESLLTPASSSPEVIRHDNDRFRIEMETQAQIQAATVAQSVQAGSLRSSVQSLAFPTREQVQAQRVPMDVQADNDDPLAKVDRTNSIRNLRMPAMPDSIQTAVASETPVPMNDRRVDRMTQGADSTLQEAARHTVQRPLTRLT